MPRFASSMSASSHWLSFSGFFSSMRSSSCVGWLRSFLMICVFFQRLFFCGDPGFEEACERLSLSKFTRCRRSELAFCSCSFCSQSLRSRCRICCRDLRDRFTPSSSCRYSSSDSSDSGELSGAGSPPAGSVRCRSPCFRKMLCSNIPKLSSDEDCDSLREFRRFCDPFRFCEVLRRWTAARSKLASSICGSVSR